VQEVYKKYRVGSCYLERILEKEYGVMHITTVFILFFESMVYLERSRRSLSGGDVEIFARGTYFKTQGQPYASLLYS